MKRVRPGRDVRLFHHQSKIGRLTRCKAAALALVLIALPPAYADVRDEAQRLLQERQEQERQDTLTRPLPHVTEPPVRAADTGIDPARLEETGPAFLIRRIELRGDVVLSAATRQSIVTPFLGLELGPRRIDLLLQRITSAYLDRGYITTRAYIAPQNLASGTLEVTVIPGSIESVRLNDAPLSGAARSALPESADGMLRLPDVEQAVDQINRLRSQRAEAQILPGQSPGSSVVALTNRPDTPWRLSLGTDNYGQPSTGEGRLRYGAEFDNLFGAWDAWSANHVEAKDSRADLLSVSVPFGYGTFSYAFAQSVYRTPLGSIAVSTGSSRNQTLAWNQVLDRDARGRTALDASLALRESWRRLNDVELTPQQQSALRLALSRQQRLSIGSVSGEIGISRGLDAFAYDKDLPGLPDSAMHNQFRKLDASFAAIVSLGTDWAWRGNVSAQASQTGLPGAEQIFAGGASSVRGFQEGAVVGDRGYVLRNELQWTGDFARSVLADGMQLVPFLLADASRTRLLADAEGKRLSSVGCGVRLAWKYASLDAAWARPLAAPVGVLKADRMHASLSFQF